MTLATSAAPLNSERRGTSVPGTRALVSSQQLILKYPWDTQLHGPSVAGTYSWSPVRQYADYFSNANAVPETLFQVLRRCRKNSSPGNAQCWRTKANTAIAVAT